MRALIVPLALAALTCGTANAQGVSHARNAAQPAATSDRPGRTFRFPTVGAAFVTLRPTTVSDVYEAADLESPGTGRLSLREAFALANRLDTEVAIVLERGGVYRLERCGSLTDRGALNELVHNANKPLTINGNAATIFQDCDGAGVIVQEGGDQLLNLVDLTIAGGRSRQVRGGGVWNSGTGEVRITNTVVRDNQVNAPAPTEPISAGGVASLGNVIVSGATISENVASAGAGGIASAGAVKVIKSSFYANRGRRAGAIEAGANTAQQPSGGAPAFIGSLPDGITLVYSTLKDNSRPVLKTARGLTSFASVIEAQGTGRLCELAPDHVTSLGSNFVSGGRCSLKTEPSDREDASRPGLHAIPGMKQVDVFAPAANSPLRDAIPPPTCMPERVRPLLPVYSGGTSDELGVSRPQGRGCDIGAIEAVEPGQLARKSGPPPMSDLPRPLPWSPPDLGLPAGLHVLRVTTTRDTSTAAGERSLRQAMAEANSLNGATIVLAPAAVYRLDRCEPPQSARDNDANDLIYVGNGALRIEGNGSTILQTCDGSGVLAIFSEAEVTLAGVTIAGGRSVIHPGGGIYMAGAGVLRLAHSWITDNSSVAAGGGIASFGDVSLFDSTVSDNHSTEVGGGIIATADVTAINSSLFDNTADLAIGAIGNHSGKLALLFTTIVHNSAPNVAVGSIAAFGSIIASYLEPRFHPPPGAGPPPPGGLPPPANCDVEHPASSHGVNYASDPSCGFSTVGGDPQLARNRATAPTYLIPAPQSPVARLLSAEQCASFAHTLDQTGAPRTEGASCAAGAVALKQSALETVGKP